MALVSLIARCCLCWHLFYLRWRVSLQCCGATLRAQHAGRHVGTCWVISPIDGLHCRRPVKSITGWKWRGGHIYQFSGAAEHPVAHFTPASPLAGLFFGGLPMMASARRLADNRMSAGAGPLMRHSGLAYGQSHNGAPLAIVSLPDADFRRCVFGFAVVAERAVVCRLNINNLPQMMFAVRRDICGRRKNGR